MPPSSYLLCGTPRTGSTFLCGLLSSTGVAGHPESYFREPDEQCWSRRLGVAGADFAGFVTAVSAAGRTENGVFAARVHEKQADELNDAWARAYRDRPGRRSR